MRETHLALAISLGVIYPLVLWVLWADRPDLHAAMAWVNLTGPMLWNMIVIVGLAMLLYVPFAVIVPLWRESRERRRLRELQTSIDQSRHLLGALDRLDRSNAEEAQIRVWELTQQLEDNLRHEMTRARPVNLESV